MPRFPCPQSSLNAVTQSSSSRFSSLFSSIKPDLSFIERPIRDERIGTRFPRLNVRRVVTLRKNRIGPRCNRVISQSRNFHRDMKMYRVSRYVQRYGLNEKYKSGKSLCIYIYSLYVDWTWKKLLIYSYIILNFNQVMLTYYNH